MNTPYEFGPGAEDRIVFTSRPAALRTLTPGGFAKLAP